MFNFFKNRELKKKRKIKLVSIVKAEIKKMEEKAENVANEDNNRNRKWDDEHNSKCPKCGSKNVNDRIKRQQGSIDSEISSRSWSALTFGSGSLSGSIKGEFDTNEVNKCNDCSHEWKKYSTKYEWKGNILEEWCRKAVRYLEKRAELDNVSYDPLDTKEEFTSLEEKTAHLKKDLDTYYAESVKNAWSGISISTLTEMCKDKLSSYSYEEYAQFYNEQYLVQVGLRKITDEELDK